MRTLAAVIAAMFVCACNSPRHAGEHKSTDTQDAVTQHSSRSGVPNPGKHARDSAEAATVATATRSSAGDGRAELQELAARGRLVGSGSEEVAAGGFVADVASTPSTYAGEYHFGDSEGESGLALKVQGSVVTGTLVYADWEKDTWVPKEVRFEGGRIEGVRLTAPGWKGVFVRYNGSPGLLILEAPTDMLGVEFGFKQKPEAGNDRS